MILWAAIAFDNPKYPGHTSHYYWHFSDIRALNANLNIRGVDSKGGLK